MLRMNWASATRGLTLPRCTQTEVRTSSGHEGTQTIFVGSLAPGLHHKGESSIGKLLPYRQVGVRDRQPAEREQVAAGFGHSPDLRTGHLVDHRTDHNRMPLSDAHRTA